MAKKCPHCGLTHPCHDRCEPWLVEIKQRDLAIRLGALESSRRDWDAAPKQPCRYCGGEVFADFHKQHEAGHEMRTQDQYRGLAVREKFIGGLEKRERQLRRNSRRTAQCQHCGNHLPPGSVKAHEKKCAVQMAPKAAKRLRHFRVVLEKLRTDPTHWLLNDLQGSISRVPPSLAAEARPVMAAAEARIKANQEVRAKESLRKKEAAAASWATRKAADVELRLDLQAHNRKSGKAEEIVARLVKTRASKTPAYFTQRCNLLHYYELAFGVSLPDEARPGLERAGYRTVGKINSELTHLWAYPSRKQIPRREQQGSGDDE